MDHDETRVRLTETTMQKVEGLLGAGVSVEVKTAPESGDVALALLTGLGGTLGAEDLQLGPFVDIHALPPSPECRGVVSGEGGDTPRGHRG